MGKQSRKRVCGYCKGTGVYIIGTKVTCPSCGGTGRGARWLTGTAGHVHAGRTLKFMGVEGLLRCLDGPVPFTVGVEGETFIHARSLEDGTVHSLDASHPAWVLATEEGV